MRRLTGSCTGNLILVNRTDLQITQATPEDAPELSTLAQQAYFDHFPYLWTDGGVQYATTTFAVDQIRRELTDTNVRCFIARQNDQAIGYTQLRLRAPLNKTTGLELHRIYLLASAAGQGVGKQLVREAVRVADETRRPFVWLKVMQSSQASIAFYQRMGFRPHAETTFEHPLLRPEYRKMLIMKRGASTP